MRSRRSNSLFLGSSFLACLLATAGIGQAQNTHWPRTYDLKHVAWKVVIQPESKTIKAEVTETLRPLSPGLKEIAFDFGQLTVSRVVVGGVPTPFKRESGRLIVMLDRSAASNADLRVTIRYEGKPDAGLYFVDAVRAYPARTPIVYTQGEMEDNRYWLPIYDYPDDKASSEGTIVVPKSWFALSNGQLVDTKDVKEGKAYHWRCDQPHSTYLISLVAGPYGEGKESWDGIPVNFYYPEGLEAMGRAAFGGTARMVKFFSEQTGVRYPYAKFAQVAVADFMFGGMENISAVTNTIGALHHPNELPFSSAEGLVLHELAHQWFGDLATTVNWSHIWLNEGFASFLPNFYVRKFHGAEAYDIGRYHLLEGAFQAAQGPRPMVSTDYLKPMDMFDGNAYGGGAARMFMLMDLLGENVFWTGLKAYLDKYRFANATTEDFFKVMEGVSGKDLDTFRKQWFYQAGAPKLTVKRGELGSIKIVQDGPLFHVKTPLWALNKDGTWFMLDVNLDAKEVSIAAEMGEAPILLDPYAGLMGEIKYDLGYTSDDWVMLYRNAPNAAQKLRLLVQMARANHGDLIDLLAREEKSRAILAEMVPSLGLISAELVLALSRSADRQLMAAAVQRLGRLPKSEAAAARLKEVYKSDRSDMMRRWALESLMLLAPDQSLIDEAWHRESDWDTLRSFALQWWAEHNPDLARDRCLDMLAHPISEPLRLAAVSHLGSLKDRPGQRAAFEALMKVVQEDGFGPRMNAIRALAQYGNPEALTVLRKLAEHPQFFMRDAAKSAVAELEKARR
jgi:aminopeptidase N